MIDKAITREIIKEQIEQLRNECRRFVNERGWRIEVEDTTVHVGLESKRDEKRYMLRIQCDNYPEGNPSVIFVDPSSRKQKLSAWPIIRPKVGTPAIQTDRMFICFRPKFGYPFTIGEIIFQIQSYLDSEDYKGRHPG